MFQLKFVEGAKPGQPVKRKTTEDEKKEDNKKRNHPILTQKHLT